MTSLESVAVCGLDCVNCPAHVDNITAVMRKQVSGLTGLPEEKAACRGCRIDGHCPWMRGCATAECAREKGVAYCGDCGEFPCAKLMPAADGAAKYPHNMKVFNLCRVKAVGVDRFLAEEAKRIRAYYFGGKFIPGGDPGKQG
jgi:hypothetical protein